MNTTQIIYSLTIEYLQTVAEEEIERELSPEEIECISEILSEKINWYDAIAEAINEKINWRILLRSCLKLNLTVTVT